ncbi:MAG: sigma-70 family RNA polymerase sigma factor [Bacteroidales bacterium]|nr:sigma-70 family RNA polymerase sigma factor [Clostridium sp.]MCM1204346.1 sigma-70 family RNA polymerase sigma factor [Bacteroidales bacterium]
MNKLIKEAMDGNADSFVELMKRNMQSMYKTAWVYLKNDSDVADAIQDTILVCYEKMDTLRQAKYFKTWMTRILINKCKDILRTRMDYEDIETAGEFGMPDKQFDALEWKQMLSVLDEKYSTVLLMYYYDGLSVKEIGTILQLNKNTVLTRLRRARKLLKEEYCFSGEAEVN